jgi:ketosteroid isomerase-like protein
MEYYSGTSCGDEVDGKLRQRKCDRITSDPKTTEEIRAFVKECEKGFNKPDSVALAPLCTEDAVQVSPEGPICGRQAIEKK